MIKLRASRQTTIFVIEDDNRSNDDEPSLHNLTVDSAKALAEFVDDFTSETFERELYEALGNYLGVSNHKDAITKEGKQ